jgi:hypothetical protein
MKTRDSGLEVSGSRKVIEIQNYFIIKTKKGYGEIKLNRSEGKMIILFWVRLNSNRHPKYILRICTRRKGVGTWSPRRIS